MTKTCKMRGCGRTLLAKGYCNTHYQQGRRLGWFKVQRPTVVNAGGCSVGGCAKPAYGRGHCQAHYEKLRKYGDPLASAPKKTGGPCSTVECSSAVIANGLCRNCYRRVQTRGTVEYSAWYKRRFEKLTDEHGYVHVYAPDHPNARQDGRVPEHRYVMSQIIGRALLPGENVHHRNGRRNDNRPKNLELWVRTQPSGQRPADIVAWACEMLARYPDELLAALDPKARVAA